MYSGKTTDNCAGYNGSGIRCRKYYSPEYEVATTIPDGLMGLGFRQDIPSDIFIDNQTAKKKNGNPLPMYSKRSQYINIGYRPRKI